MSQELAYVLINPYTIVKSRTGGVMARLLARSNLQMVAARMFSPSKELIKEYADAIVKGREEAEKPEIAQLIKKYIEKNYAPDPKTGQRKRVMMIVFKGENASKRLVDEVVGHITYATVGGETIRDTYGDYIVSDTGEVKYFEPAVLTAPTREHAEIDMKIWSKHSDKDGGLLEDVVKYPAGSNVEKTLVMIKPDNFKMPSIRVGNIIDMFSKTGLYIIGARLVHVTVDQAEEFYAPVKDMLEERLKDKVKEKISSLFQAHFEFPIPEEMKNEILEKMNPLNARHEFNKIVGFITGVNPSEIKNPADKKRIGQETCLALVYQGINAVEKIRAVLGSTDPSKAAPATVRKEFGQNVMINTAHASDSVENAEREINILDVAGNDIKQVVETYCESNQ